MALENLPRFKLSHLNTPLETLERLKQDLSERGISTPDRILIKREDATGLAFGGNKGRHFEFEMGHILEGGFDTVININHYHSNQARFLAAGCAKAGLKYHIISTDMVTAPITGNLLLCKLMGAVIHRTPAEYGRQMAEKIFSDVVKDGGNPYILPDDPFADIMGMIGFLETGLELEKQFESAGIDGRSEEHTSELQSLVNLVCRLLLEKKKQKHTTHTHTSVIPCSPSTSLLTS